MTFTLRGLERSAELLAALAGPIHEERTIDGASTVTMDIADADHSLLRSGILSHRCWCDIDGTGYEIAAIRKNGTRLQLEFEDSLVAALRRKTDPLVARAGTCTRMEFLSHLAAEAEVPMVAEPDEGRGAIRADLSRGSAQGGETSWDAMGRIAGEVGWRRFSDGHTVFAGSDAWLSSLVDPTTLREGVGGVDTIDFDLDVGKPAAEATLAVALRDWALAPGEPAALAGCGPGDGPWIVSKVSRTLTSLMATVTLVARQSELPEPEPDAGTGADGDKGETVYLPGGETPDPGGLGSPSIEKMIGFAKAQSGKPYVWGAKGPRAYDCSGLVVAAARAGGAALSGNARSISGEVAHISVGQAVATRGALLLRIGAGGTNHVAISLGNNTTVEARGRAYGCGVFGNAGRRRWTTGGIIPGMGTHPKGAGL